MSKMLNKKHIKRNYSGFCTLFYITWSRYCAVGESKLIWSLTTQSTPRSKFGSRFHDSARALLVRGGDQSEHPFDQEYPYPPTQPQHPSTNGFDATYDTSSQYVLPNEFIPPGEDDPFHETVQDRVDSWKRQQREQQQHQSSPLAAVSPTRDSQGRMQLMATVSKGSRALIFFLLMWRTIHLYETATLTFSKSWKGTLVNSFLAVLFLSNLAGAVASISSPSHSAKKRLKAILNLDKLVEVSLLLWSFLRLTLVPSKDVAREIYIANALHSVFFLIQCQAFTKVSWDEKLLQSMAEEAREMAQSSIPVATVEPNEEINYWQQQQRQQQGQRDSWGQKPQW